MREDVRLIILDSLNGLIKEAHGPRIIKNNMAVRPDPLGFRIDDQDLHFGRLPSPQPSQLEQAVIFFRDCLADGPLPATEVKAAAMAAGVAATTLKRAKKRLRIVSTKRAGYWTWELPPTRE
jgi:hypothetical protein